MIPSSKPIIPKYDLFQFYWQFQSNPAFIKILSFLHILMILTKDLATNYPSFTIIAQNPKTFYSQYLGPYILSK